MVWFSSYWFSRLIGWLVVMLCLFLLLVMLVMFRWV